MKTIVKSVAVSSCCLAIGVAAANAEPTVLADAELDRVTAGDSQPTRLGTGLFGLGLFFPPGEINCLALGCPGSPPSGPVPTEPPGCETGACVPGAPFPSFPFPGNRPPFVLPTQPFLFFLGGGCGGPAGTCPGIGF